uniref:Uncharacterized protein n=1 Tax=Panagrellus redivivus TaxID=6233 RepID=A0A7E4UNZ1_PANRE
MSTRLDALRIEKDNVVAEYRRRHRTDAKGVKKFDSYLTCLCDFDQYFKYPSLAKWLGEMPWQNYYFFHAVDSPPTVDDVKTYLLEKDERRAFTVITIDELFTNFNKASRDRPVGAFTHCLYELMLQKVKNSKYPNFTMDHLIVTGIDDYTSDDGYKEICKLLHLNNLKEYYDEAMPNLKVNAAKVKFIFTCTELPEMMLWRLAEDLIEKIIIEPDTINKDQRETYRYALAMAAAEDWVKMTVNCTSEVESRIQTVLNAVDSQVKDVLTTKLTYNLQKKLRRWYPNWRVCGMEVEPTWRFTVPCVVYQKLERWYLMFYAPLEWSDRIQFLEDVAYDCGSDNDEVMNRFKEIKTNQNANNLNSIEHDLNTVLGYPISIYPHQNSAGIHDRAILVKHRETYLSINVALKNGFKELPSAC